MIKSIGQIFNLRNIFVVLIYLIFKNNKDGTYRTYEIKEESMEPSLYEGDYVLASKFTDSPSRGDIVVYEYETKNIEIVKRIIGLPGETISSKEGQININGEKINDPWGNGEVVDFENITLKEDEDFVLGDNREMSSSDSLSVGPIKLETCWKLRFLYWPYHKFKKYE